MTVLSALVAALESADVEVVDLTAPLSPSTPVLQLPPPFANTIPLSLEAVSAFDDAGPAWKWNNIHTGEHTGTHLDAPAHWITARDGETVDAIPPSKLIGPVVVVDVRAQVAADPDFLLEPEHVEAWEAEHGRVPDGAWLLLRTGWSARQEDAVAFANADENGPHTPGPSARAARWLASERTIAGFGVETVGIDAGAAGGFEPPFPAHHFLLEAGTYGLTQLRNLEKLPATGAVLVVSPLPIVGGTGSPSRVFALVEK
ncbi:cyclase family protein [Cryptosporangium arvum]|uniref:Putative metal-dependent hydrolase n=1 Tax=Cryptosporangium arvum DSM 44712 TaxID=927661 RepID=A0A010YNT0_9ACTN|nr:cyclase family protein [Cryptosporangium arvum]EXG81825.1 putative metal-dependent hydrolase [Cryptosporangium arvum DSM 44712]